jgi:tricorn protease
LKAERLTDNRMTDNMPMWIGNTIYFNSDREHTLNLYSLDPASKRVTKVTNHNDYDVLWPSAGPGGIVYQCGGRLWVFDPATGTDRQVPVTVASDRKLSLPCFKPVGDRTTSFGISPSGKRALFEARGDIFTVPAKNGLTRNITATQGVRELAPAWSPDGSTIAYISDQSGEYQIWVRNADGTGEARQVTSSAPTWLFEPRWSPDGKHIAYSDKLHVLRVVDVATGKSVVVDTGKRADITHYEWSPDSRWLAYSNAAPSGLTAIWVWPLESKKPTMLSSGNSNDYGPVFSRDGNYIFFMSTRDFNLTFSAYEFAFVYNNAARVYAGLLMPRGPQLKPFRNDDEQETQESKSQGEKQKSGTSVRVDIDPASFADRVTALTNTSGNYGNLRAGKGCVLYQKYDNGSSKLMRYDIEKQKEEEVMAGIDAYDLSEDAGSIIYSAQGKYGIVESRPGQKSGDGVLDLSRMQMRIDPHKEWAQIFNDAWRLMRDWFYDPKMHGVDWPAMKERYGQLVPFVEHRADLDFILGEMIGELNAGHTYVNAGDEPRVQRKEGGMLGCEFTADGSGFYKISRILKGENWHRQFRSPLAEPGLDVKEGDYLIAIDGIDLPATVNPYQLLENKASTTVTLTVNSKPSRSGAHDIYVETISQESELRTMDWVRRTREYVEKKSGGRIGYIWLPNTAAEGTRELFKWFYPQAGKEALIIDDRYNGGGFIPYNMSALLGREPLNYWARRGIEPFTAPDVFHKGPKVCLINGYSSSGGDALPYYFRKLGMGKLIGTRTWGGLIGLSGNPGFIDGGSLNIPTFRIYDTEGNWIIENEGVTPDIEVVDSPDLVAKGIDPSVEKAIETLLDELNRNPVRKPVPPPPPDESK